MKVKDTLVKAFYKTSFEVKKASPEMLLGVGVIGLTVGTVMACKATTRAEEVMADSKKTLDIVKDCKAKADKGELDQEYTDKDYKKDLTLSYSHMALNYAKLYGPAVGIWILSLGCVLTSHGIMRKRNLALAAAYSTLDNGFKFYRGNVVDKFGEKVDREMRYGIKAEEVEEKTTDKDGNEKVTKKKKDIATAFDDDAIGDYAKFFDESSREWTKDSAYNLMFLKQAQAHFNDILKIRGYVFLNEVYKWLDIPETLAGQCVGWVYDKDNPLADNHIDFGIYKNDGTVNTANVRFVNGYEEVILLDFNVDGSIMDTAFKFHRP